MFFSISGGNASGIVAEILFAEKIEAEGPARKPAGDARKIKRREKK